MLANQKTDPKLPPPLPSGKPPPLPPRKPAAGGGIARARAFLAIQRMRLGERTRRIVAWVRRRPLAASAIAAAVILVAAGGAAIALDAVPDVDLNPFAPKSLADARAEARTHPDKATAKRELGHALWAAKRHHSAVRAYSRALAADAGVADDQMISHLVASFGGRDQREAEALIWKNKLVGAEAGLHGLLKSKRHGVRWGAVHTLDRLEKGAPRLTSSARSARAAPSPRSARRRWTTRRTAGGSALAAWANAWTTQSRRSSPGDSGAHARGPGRATAATGAPLPCPCLRQPDRSYHPVRLAVSARRSGSCSHPAVSRSSIVDTPAPPSKDVLHGAERATLGAGPVGSSRPDDTTARLDARAVMTR